VIEVSRAASFLVAGVVSSWFVPALIFLLVVAVSLGGLRWIRSEHLDALASVPLFSSLSRNRLLAVLRSTRSVDFPPGVEIVTEGEKGKGFFVITKGSAEVAVGGANHGALSQGAYFGDIAVIDGGPRSATITAKTRVSTLELTPSSFRSLLDREPSINRAIFQELSRRVGDSSTSVEMPNAPADRATMEELCQRLRTSEHPDWAQPERSRRSGLRGFLSPRS
jgi:CRP/FNR family transcriptional regulator, cyclic AMP receptor protein